MLNYSLLTPYAENLNRETPLKEYPRPQLRRDSYLNLNGQWKLAFSESGDIDAAPQYRITMPFPPESCLSEVMRTPRKGEYLIYRREFSLPEDFCRDITLLHVGAADQICEVFCNGQLAARHEGGYLPFTADLTRLLKSGRNTLVLRVRDDLDYLFPTGKQRRQRGGIWYSPISGVWQTVWLESVSRDYVKGVKITPDVVRGCVNLEIDSDCDGFAVTALDGEQAFFSKSGCGHSVAIEIPAERMKLWSPESPFLYGLVIETPHDRVSSYFAMRSFRADGKRFLLNGKPYFVNGLLDQGYFSDGIYTPADYAAYRDDILTAKKLGFNALRKHIKVEPLMFYHLCDRLGILVLQDMVNVGRYSLIKDSALPLAGFKRRLPWVAVSKAQQAVFTAHSLELQRHLYNCPCVVYYTIFNEGWGQSDADGEYERLKNADPTRVYDATSGWFRAKRSDVASEHIYFKPIRLKKEDKTLIVSEFGGYSHRCGGHIFNDKNNFGYRGYNSLAELEDGFIALFENEILANLDNGLAGAIYTQLSDVEDETNGILTYDRRVCKLSAERIEPLMRQICEKANRG